MPFSLHTDAQLAQFLGGGTLEHHAQQILRERATEYGTEAVGAVHVGANGVMWQDEDEELEFAHLLGGEVLNSPGKEWVTFGEEEGTDLETSRRSSLQSGGSLDPMDVVKQETSTDSLPLFDIFTAQQPGMSILALPARPRRAARHLRAAAFMQHADAFQPYIASTPCTSAHFTERSEKGRAVRRPPPLDLIQPVPSYHEPSISPLSVRQNFLDESFAPSLTRGTVHVEHTVVSSAQKGKKTGVMRFFQVAVRKRT
jgi:hypothetical protein